MAVLLTKDNFKKEVLESDVPVLVDFWADWCGPCKMLMPVIEELAAELTDVKIGKVNVDEQPDLMTEYKIMSIPTLMVFREGKMTQKVSGAIAKKEILALLA